MIPQIGPFASDRKRPESMLPQIPLQVGSINPTRPAAVERTLDLFRFGNRSSARLLTLPILHDHRNPGRAAAVLLLSDEWDIQPDARPLGGNGQTAKKEGWKDWRSRAEHGTS